MQMSKICVKLFGHFEEKTLINFLKDHEYVWEYTEG